MSTKIRNRAMVLIAAMIAITAASTQLRADIGGCGDGTVSLPFTDVPASNVFFCEIAEAYFSGLTNGTSATTFSPSENVPRDQMAAFVTRTMNLSVTRSSRRAALDQFWTYVQGPTLPRTTIGTNPALVKSDGTDIWVANSGSGTVSRVRASDGVKLGDWTGATNAFGVLVALGKVFITGETNPGTLYEIDPAQPPGAVTVLTANLGAFPDGIAFDGHSIWTANSGGSVLRVTFDPLTVTTTTTGLIQPVGITFDGDEVWITDTGDNRIKRINGLGNIDLSVPAGVTPYFPAFDGANIWIPDFGEANVTVVRAKGSLAGTVLHRLSTFTTPVQAAFDGERVLVTLYNGNGVTMWNASDMALLPYAFTGSNTSPFGACSDGVNFWITLFGAGKLARL
jgi:hypothetical protein